MRRRIRAPCNPGRGIVKNSLNRLLPNRWLGVLTGLLCLAAWDAGRVSAQPAESLPLPQVAGQNLEQELSEPEDYEVLARGPVHEAFADPVGLDTEAVVIAPEPPPPPVQEQPPETRPTGENVIWIPGYWFWDDQEEDYIYVSGLWRDVPPGRRWTPGYWHEVEAGYQWQPGFWISETQEEVTYLPPPPETLEVGPNIAAPSDDHFWIPGCWQYTPDDYVWRSGFWSPIHSGWIWVPAHYVPTAYGYVYVDGYWDYEPGHRGLLYASVIFRRPVYISPNYYYRPRFALGHTAALLVNLFIRPSYGMYYYGNYYSPHYYDLGFHPWYSPIGGRSYVSPVVSYYRWKYARHGIDFHDRMHLWRERYESYGPDRRPRFFEPRQRASIASGVASPLGANGLELISSMDSLVRERDSRFTEVDENQRQQFESLSREIRSIADLRQRQDLDGVRSELRPGERLDRPDLGDGESDPRRNRIRGNFTLPESYRMGRPNIDGDRGRSRDGDRDRDAARMRAPGLTDRDIDGRPGRGIDGRQLDGRQFDGRQLDGRQFDGRQLDDRQLDGRQLDRRQLDGRQLDGRQLDGRPGRGIDGRQLDGDSRRSGSRMLAPGSGMPVPDLGSRTPGRGIQTPGSDSRRLDSGLRIPDRSLRGPGSGLGIPDSDSRRPGSELRIPRGDLRGPGSSLRSGGRPEQGLDLRPNIERAPAQRPGRDRSGGLDSRSLRGLEMQSPRSISPGSGIGGSRRSFGSGDSGRAESRGRGNRGGDGIRGGGGNRGGDEDRDRGRDR